MAASSSFKIETDKTYARPLFRFQFDDTDYSAYFIRAGQISRDSEITAGSVNIDVVNTGQTFNLFYTVPSSLGKTAQIELYFSGLDEYESLFKGTVEKVYYNEDGTATLQCRDKMATMLEKSIGYGTAPVTYAATGPATLVWNILTSTTYGQLSSTASSTNPDIAYNAWQTFRSDGAAHDFQLAARFTGQKIQEALQLIGDLTDTLIWVNGDGKVDFRHSFYSSDRAFTRSNCLAIEREIAREHVVNTVGVGYGYDINTGFWTGLTSASSVLSQTNYGKKPVYFESKIVWHATSTSAIAFRDHHLGIYASPLLWVHLTSTLYGYTAYIGSEGQVTEALLGLDASDIRIESVDGIDVNTGLIYLTGKLI